MPKRRVSLIQPEDRSGIGLIQPSPESAADGNQGIALCFFGLLPSIGNDTLLVLATMKRCEYHPISSRNDWAVLRLIAIGREAGRGTTQ